MDKRGQLISLDVVLSLVLLTFALAYAFRVAETNFYVLKQEELTYETKAVGSAAAELLVTVPETTCEVTTLTGENFHITNCIDTAKLSSATFSFDKLGIDTSRFDARIEWSAGSIGNPVPTDKTIYSEKRVVIIKPGGLTKSDLEACFSGSVCTEETITIYVWRR